MSALELPSLGSAHGDTQAGGGTQEEEFDDDFDLFSWRLEAEHELRHASTIAQEAWRVDQLANSVSQRVDKLHPSASTSSFASKATVRSSKSSVSRTTPKQKLPPLALLELQSGLQADERLTIAQAVFSPYEPMLANTYRGNTNAVLAVRDLCALRTARERLRHIEEVGAEQRQQAVLWREKAVKDGLMVSARTSQSDSKPVRIHKLMHSFMKLWVQRDPELALAEFTNMEQGHFTKLTDDSDSEEDVERIIKGKGSKNRGGYYASVIKATVTARIHQREKADKRQKHQHHQNKAKQDLQARVKDCPFVDREKQAEQSAFANFADQTTGTMCLENLLRCLAGLGLTGSHSLEKRAVEVMLTRVYLSLFGEAISADPDKVDPAKAKLAKKKLAQLGSEPPESSALLLPASEVLDMEDDEVDTRTTPEANRTVGTVEPFVSIGFVVQAFVELAVSHKEKENLLELGPRGGLQRSARYARAKNTHRKELQALLRRVPICFDEFSRDIVSIARQQLSEMREKQDSPVVRAELEQSAASTISSDQFKVLAARFCLNSEQVTEALREARFLARVKDLGKPWLNLHEIHDLLQYTRELYERHQHCLQLTIKNSADLTDATFWKFRGDLTKLSDQFKSMSLPLDAKQPKVVVCQLLKQLGFQPYHVRMQSVLNSCFKRAGGNQGADLSFSQILHLKKYLRDGQKVARREKLWRVFKVQMKSLRTSMPTQRLEEVIFNPVLRLNLHVDTIVEKEALAKLVERASTSLEITFQEVEEVCQNACELLHGMRAKANFAKAMFEGMSMKDYSEYQQLYDKYDVDCSGGLEADEVREAMRSKLGRAISSNELAQCYAAKQLNPNVSLQLWDFLRVIEASVTHDTSFTLKDVPRNKLWDCISLLPINRDNISPDSETEYIMALVAGYLSITSDTDMKQLSSPINNVEELLQRASKEVQDWWERIEKNVPAHADIEDDH